VLFEWDKDKRRTNVHKHGIDFQDAEAVFVGHTVTIEDTRLAYGERRLVTFGLLRASVVAIVHTETEDVIRIISMRKASKHEERTYFLEIRD